MFTYQFNLPINMLTLDVSQYTNGSVNFATFSSTSMEIDDSNGDKAFITGKNFAIDFATGQPSGTVTGAVLKNAMGQTILTATSLNIDLNKLYNDRASKPKLFADLFSGGVKMIGSTGNDALLGGTGNDVIMANKDNDVLIGGAGHDALYGGLGNTQFRYYSINDSLYASPDVIQDFHTGDKIDLSRVDSNNALTGVQHTWHLGKTVGHTGDVVVSYSSTTNLTTILLYDDADGAPDGRILLRGNHANLATTDFIGVAPPPPAATHRFASAVAAFAPAHTETLAGLTETHSSPTLMMANPRFAHA